MSVIAILDYKQIRKRIKLTKPPSGGWKKNPSQPALRLSFIKSVNTLHLIIAAHSSKTEYTNSKTRTHFVFPAFNQLFMAIWLSHMYCCSHHICVCFKLKPHILHINVLDLWSSAEKRMCFVSLECMEMEIYINRYWCILMVASTTTTYYLLESYVVLVRVVTYRLWMP